MTNTEKTERLSWLDQRLQTALFVPMEVNALRLFDDSFQSNQEIVAAGSMVDFSKLPQSSIEPQISKGMVTPPFDKSSILGSGTHLHWTLPEAFTRGKEVNGKMVFPIVPNRWLIRKYNVGLGTYASQVLVESDYIHYDPQNLNLDHNEQGSMYPINWEITNAAVENKQYCRIGRKILLREFQGDGGERPEAYNLIDQGEYLMDKPGHELTGIGYGNHYFNAFYPNCRNVFGVNEVTPRTNDDEYHIMGWYSDPQKDILRQAILSTLWEDADQDRNLTSILLQSLWSGSGWGRYDDREIISNAHRQKVYERIQQLFDWNIQDPGDISFHGGPNFSDPRPAMMPTITVCYGTVRIQGNVRLDTALSALKVSLGRSTQEAMAVNKSANEEELTNNLKEAFADQVEGGELDKYYKMEEASHQATFKAIDNGYLWRVVDKKQEGAKALTSFDALDNKRLEEDLRQLNEYQQTYNDIAQKLEMLKDQLFKDWYRYNLLKDPENGLSAEETQQQLERYQELIRWEGVLALDEKQQELQQVTSQIAPLKNSIEELIVAVNQASAGKEEWILETVAAPRYYAPTDPSMVIKEPAERTRQNLEKELFDKAKENVEGDNQVFDADLYQGLICYSEHFHKFVKDDSKITVADLANFFPPEANPANIERQMPDGENYHHHIIDGTKIPHYTMTNAHWNPVMVNWEVAYQGEGHISPPANDLYDPDFLATHYTFQDVGVDFARKNNTSDKIAMTFKGRSILAPYQTESDVLIFNVENFQKILLTQQLDAQLNIQAAEDDPVATLLAPYLNTQEAIFSSPIVDPERPLSTFLPISSGTMEVRNLTLVDSFGYITELTNQIAIAPLSQEAGQPQQLFLPPRITQPARVNFRWLSAHAVTNTSANELTVSPTDSPICGWLVPSFTENTLTVFDEQGKTLGIIQADGRWQHAPGESSPVGTEEILNPYLRKVVSYILSKDIHFRNDFMAVAQKSLENIEPEDFSGQGDLAYMTGTPLAVIRAYVDLELQSVPEYFQGTQTFEGGTRRKLTRDFTKVNFPIRVGEYEQANDGLVGYWVEESEGGNFEDKFYAPQSGSGVANDLIVTDDSTENDCYVPQSLESPKSFITMLVDVRGSVHATTGILPTKSITIPPEQYQLALQNLSVTFPARPIITPLDKVTLDVAQETGYRWEWLQKHGNTWQEIAVGQQIRQDRFTRKFGESLGAELWQELQDKGWIELQGEALDQAFVIPPSQRREEALDVAYFHLLNEVEDLLAYVYAMQTGATFDSENVIREGWLRLSKL
ncbi:MAG TPA: hypothetical protein DCS93_12795 [Microscillaceae bacterium]|nr:hypothetical protein [Microscillaceae bacterium]